ncbi:MAG: YceI family protein, partial [Planctomycetes bacterium]|nr:YceI family protein [Planctomycetota bacterium]
MISRACSLILVCLAAPTWAAQSYTVDPKTSKVAFTGHSTFHDFQGTAKVTKGTITLDGERSSGAVVVDATTMDTEKKGRDQDMHAKMETAKHPSILFTLTKVSGPADAPVAHGTWSMHGVDKQLEIPFRISGDASPRLSATFKVNFNDFRVIVPRNFGMKVDPSVDVSVELALTPVASTAPAAPEPS